MSDIPTICGRCGFTRATGEYHQVHSKEDNDMLTFLSHANVEQSVEIANLKDKLRQAEEERNCNAELSQIVHEIMDSEQWQDGRNLVSGYEVAQRLIHERDQARARVGELEEALAFIRDYLDTCAEPPELRGQNECTRRRAKRALKGKEEHGTRRDG